MVPTHRGLLHFILLWALLIDQFAAPSFRCQQRETIALCCSTATASKTTSTRVVTIQDRLSRRPSTGKEIARLFSLHVDKHIASARTRPTHSCFSRHGISCYKKASTSLRAAAMELLGLSESTSPQRFPEYPHAVLGPRAPSRVGPQGYTCGVDGRLRPMPNLAKPDLAIFI